MSVFHDEVEIEDFEYDPDTETYYYPCPCGDQFEITKVHTYMETSIPISIEVGGATTITNSSFFILIYLLRKIWSKVKKLLLVQVVRWLLKSYTTQ